MAQNNRIKANAMVKVDGFDITNKLNPYLVSIAIVDTKNLECHLELDDRNAQLPIPPLLANMEAWLGWNNEPMKMNFQGKILDFEYGFDRKQGGRRMFIHANSTNLLGRMKEPFSKHWGEDGQEGPKIMVKQILQESLATVGARLKYISPQFADKGWKYKSQDNQSVIDFAERLADELGGGRGPAAYVITKWGDQMEFRHPTDVEGDVEVTWGDDLIELRVRPFVARSAWQGASATSYDPKNAVWDTFKKKFSGQGGAPHSAAQATQSSQAPAANKEEAEQIVGGIEDKDFPGDGHIVINGNPNVMAFMHLQIKKVRPGVDGRYFIERVEHKWSRQGYTTSIEVHPDKNAPAGANVYDKINGQDVWTISDQALAEMEAARQSEAGDTGTGPGSSSQDIVGGIGSGT